MKGRQPCSVKKLLLQSPKNWKPDGLIHNFIGKSGRIFKEGCASKRAVLPMMMMMIPWLV
jgi:hypothetical protein